MYGQIIKRAAISSSALLVSMGVAGTANAACTSGNCFVYTGGANGGATQPAGSWFSMLASDTNGDYTPDANIYTAIRSAGQTGNPGPVGTLDFGVISTITTGPGGGGATQHSIGNMIDRDWSFFGSWGAHFTTATLPMVCSGNAGAPGASCNVDMAGWRVTWNGIAAINMGGGGSGTLSVGNDGIWNTPDDTLDYSAVVPAGDPSGFGGVAYGVHLVGTYDMTAAIASAFPPTFAVLDADNDGVLDSQDSAPNNNKIASPSTATSTGKVTVTIAAGALTNVKTWADTDVNLNQATKPAGVVFKDGLVDYTITGIGAGSTATIVIAYPSAVTSGLAYYKVKSTGAGSWTKMDPASANNADGGFSVAADGKTVTLTIRDGGIYDDDGVANGSIRDPGGLGADPAAAPSIPGVDAGSGGCTLNPKSGFDPTLISMLLAGLGYLGWKRKKS